MWCVCVCAASICPSKQSWQTNLMWPRKGQPHSNCLSLTLCTTAHRSFSPSTLLQPSFFRSSPFFSCSHCNLSSSLTCNFHLFCTPASSTGCREVATRYRTHVATATPTVTIPPGHRRPETICMHVPMVTPQI